MVRGGEGGRPLGLLYQVMVILQLSYGYGYTRGSGRVAIFGTDRLGTGKHHRVRVRVG